MITPISTNIGFEGVTPKEVAVALGLRDKVFCDLGAMAGQFMERCMPFAREVKGVEKSDQQAELGRNLELNITSNDFIKSDLPEADIYYAYQSIENTVSIIKKAMDSDIKKVFVFGAGRPDSRTSIVLEVMGLDKQIVKTHRGDFVLYILDRR